MNGISRSLRQVSSLIAGSSSSTRRDRNQSQETRSLSVPSLQPPESGCWTFLVNGDTTAMLSIDVSV